MLFEPLFDALNRADVRYVVVGGFATVLHGHARLTADIDLLEVDLFAEHPIDFEELWNRAVIVKLTQTVVRIASIQDLIRFFDARSVQMPGDERDRPPRDEWGAGWEAHRVHQLTLALGATPAQRLAWLEEAIMLAHRVGALPKRPSERDAAFRRTLAGRRHSDSTRLIREDRDR